MEFLVGALVGVLLAGLLAGSRGGRAYYRPLPLGDDVIPPGLDTINATPPATMQSALPEDFED